MGSAALKYDNLAEDRFEEKNGSIFDAEELQRKRKEKEELKKTKSESRKIYINVVAYGIVFLTVGSIFVNGIKQKTEYSMEIENLKKEKNNLKIDINQLKSEIDTTVNFSKIEDISREKLSMEIADEIKYIKIK